MNWSIKRKMILMGSGVIIALVLIFSINFISSRAEKSEMKISTMRINQLKIAQNMKNAQLELVLAVRDSLSAGTLLMPQAVSRM